MVHLQEHQGLFLYMLEQIVDGGTSTFVTWRKEGARVVRSE